MRVLSVITAALLLSTPALAEEESQTWVELELGAVMPSVWHFTHDQVYGGLMQETDYQIPGPAVGLRVSRDTSVSWLSVSVGLRGTVMDPTTDYLSGTTTVTVDPEEPGVSIEHDHQTDILLQILTFDASAFFHVDPGPARIGLTLGPGMRVVDVQRETRDTFFLPDTREDTQHTYSGVRVQPYLALGLRGSVEVSEGVRVGLDLGVDPAPVDLRLWEELQQVANVDNGQYSVSWDSKADMSGPLPRAALVLAVAL